jgi:hypothetical protein
MTRIILAIVAAFLIVTTVFASAAEACISCEHVPVVVRGSQTSHTATRYAKKRFYARSIAKAKARARARAIAAARAKAKARAVAAARAKAKAKAIAAAKAAAAEEVELAETTDNENSTISTASLGNDETIDTAAMANDEPMVSSNVGCKKFFPTVGMTLTVPCE